MPKLLLNLALFFLLITPKVNSQTVLKIDCSDYGLKTISESMTKTYKFFLCEDDSEYPSKYYYLGGMRKNNSDYFTLLPMVSWSDNYFRAVNDEFFYVKAPACSPLNDLYFCPKPTPETFYIYQRETLLDSEVVVKTIYY